uniref:Uncharacterized protein n=1 Tax=Oryza punctata TaxID=4537 RepID=A0A0E0MFZ3_ORYPU
MDAPELPPPPRLVDYISSIQGMERLVGLADLELDKSVVVVVSGCNPLEDAPNLFDELTTRENWCVIGMAELGTLRARLELAALAGHTQRHILRRLGRELARRATTGVVAPQELWLDIQEQRLRHAPPDSTSDAALDAEAAEEAAWAAPAGTPPDSDA